jgi:hypothetical protein
MNKSAAGCILATLASTTWVFTAVNKQREPPFAAASRACKLSI